MELLLETVALYSLKLAYETEGHSPILRDDPLMGSCDREVFELLIRRGDVAGIQGEIGRCLDLALGAVGGGDTVLGRELHRLAADFSDAQAMAQIETPLIVLKEYLKSIQ
ncbi:hypothetical protein [Pseudomonas brassicacearum]|uniref:Uncharacterized protein n=1 Tax=Pseudomonas brassicacearum TaxID=930166 RepID=A0AAJ3FWI3_9PSED|nr:hypothetical protein [Pseudomonas brassicacearum]NUT81836.1 hypothetical protein [Pseudomonas brassicacearum]